MTDIEAAIRSSTHFPEECYVGFSGGADSTALLLALHRLGVQCTAVHFNHHLRGSDADNDASWCAHFCKTRNIAFQCIDLDGEALRKSREGLEGAARAARLTHWVKLNAAHSMPVALAHHQWDALEELFLRLARGANTSGLTSLREWRTLTNGVVLWRPLLQFPKSTLEEYLRQHGVESWRHDATNDDSCCRRNIIRNKLLHLWKEHFGSLTGLSAALASLQDDAQYLEEQSTLWVKKLQTQTPSLETWKMIPKALFPRVLRQFFCLPYPPSRSTIERIWNGIATHCGGEMRVPLDGGAFVAVSHSGIRLEKYTGESPGHFIAHWKWRENPQFPLHGGDYLVAEIVESYDGKHLPLSECFDASQFPDCLDIRTWDEGDSMRPFGLNGHHRLLKHIFNEYSVFGPQRLDYPLVCAGDDILWLAPLRRGIAYPAQAAHPCVRLTLKTQRTDVSAQSAARCALSHTSPEAFA